MHLASLNPLAIEMGSMALFVTGLDVTERSRNLSIASRDKVLVLQQAAFIRARLLRINLCFLLLVHMYVSTCNDNADPSTIFNIPS